MKKSGKLLLALMVLGLSMSLYACASADISASTGGSDSNGSDSVSDTQTSSDLSDSSDSSDSGGSDTAEPGPEPVNMGAFADVKWVDASGTLDFAAGTLTGTQDFEVTGISGEGGEAVVSCTADGENYIFSLNENGALEMFSVASTEERNDVIPLRTFIAEATAFAGAWMLDDPYTHIYYTIDPVLNGDGYFEWEAFGKGADESADMQGTAVTCFAFDEEGNAGLSFTMFSWGYDYAVLSCDGETLQFDDGWYGAYDFIPYTDVFGSSVYLTEAGDKIVVDSEAGTASYNGAAAEYGAEAGAYGSGIAFAVGGKEYLLQRRIAGFCVVDGGNAVSLAEYDSERIKGAWSDLSGSNTIVIESDDKVVFNGEEYPLKAYAKDGEILYDFSLSASYTFTIYPIENADVVFSLGTKDGREEDYYFLDTAKETYRGVYTNNLEEMTVDENYLVTVKSLLDGTTASYQGTFTYLPDLECMALVYGGTDDTYLLYMINVDEAGVYWSLVSDDYSLYSAYYLTDLVPELHEMFNAGLESETDVYTTGGTAPETLRFDFEAGTVVYNGEEYSFFWGYEFGMASSYPTIVFIESISDGDDNLINIIYHSVRGFDLGVAMTSFAWDSEDDETYTYYISDAVYRDLLGISFTYRGAHFDETFVLNENGSFSMATTDTTDSDNAVTLIQYNYFLQRYVNSDTGKETIIIGFNAVDNLYLYTYIVAGEYATLFDVVYSRNDILDYIGTYYAGADTVELTREGSVKVNGTNVTLGGLAVGDGSVTVSYTFDETEYTAVFTAGSVSVTPSGGEAKAYAKRALTPDAFVGSYTLGGKTIVVTASAIGVNYELSLSVKIDGSAVTAVLGFTADGKQQLSFSVLDFATFTTTDYTITLEEGGLVLSDGTNTATAAAADWDYSDFLFDGEKTLTDSFGGTHTFVCLPKEGGKAPIFLYDGNSCSAYSVTIAADGTMILEVTCDSNAFVIEAAPDGTVTAGYKPSNIPLPPPPPPLP